MGEGVTIPLSGLRTCAISDYGYNTRHVSIPRSGLRTVGLRRWDTVHYICHHPTQWAWNLFMEFRVVEKPTTHHHPTQWAQNKGKGGYSSGTLQVTIPRGGLRTGRGSDDRRSTGLVSIPHGGLRTTIMVGITITGGGYSLYPTQWA